MLTVPLYGTLSGHTAAKWLLGWSQPSSFRKAPAEVLMEGMQSLEQRGACFSFHQVLRWTAHPSSGEGTLGNEVERAFLHCRNGKGCVKGVRGPHCAPLDADFINWRVPLGQVNI